MQTSTWNPILDRIEEALTAATDALKAREKRVVPLTELMAPPDTAEELFRRLEREGDVVAGISFFAKRAQESAKEATYAMREKEIALSAWLARAEEFRRRLADWDARAVG